MSAVSTHVLDAALGRPAADFYPTISVTFTLTDPTRHYHVAVLLSPFA